ncbi:uncharacterized protein IUM83_04769 [Phytophthora cinnamomi]|uniref:uncharacterized protein n=1 Tax=Phytophthora cinnamomi TaxID=4785 RepID=UPI00355A8C96|nr:hypothetical protein IUM83_04769 [Phytophthora cinnamomi]
MDGERAIKRSFDAVAHARITKARLIDAALQGDDTGEAEWVLPPDVDLRGRPTYQMKTILDHVRVNGRTLFLTSWEPTLETTENLPSGKLSASDGTDAVKLSASTWRLKRKKNKEEQQHKKR